MKKLHEGIWQTGQLLSHKACSQIIVQAEMMGFSRSRAEVSFGRHNDEIFLNNPALSSTVGQQLEAQINDGTDLKGMYRHIQKFLECYRYQQDDFLAPHKDGSREIDPGKWSNHTLVVFLNNSFKGGALTFPEQKLECRPAIGSAIIFEHSLIHAGCAVVSGTKYIARTSLLIE